MERVAIPPNTVQALKAAAEACLAGGVSASGRFNPSLGHALFVKGADGPWLHGADGVDYLDFNLSPGATFLGHNHPAIRQAVLEALELGVYAGYETEFHTELQRRVAETRPCAEKVRLS